MVVDPKEGVIIPTVAPVGTPEPAPVVPPTPEGKPGDPSTDVKQVPLPALQEERTKRQEEVLRNQALSQEIAELKQLMMNSQQQQQHVQQPQVNPREELDKLWEEEPRKAVKVEIMYAMDWRDRVDASLETQADALAQKYPDFNNYRSTSLGQVRSLPLNQRGGAGIVEAAYFMVRGQNTDAVLKAQEATLLEKYRRGEISAAGLSTPVGAFSTPAPVQGTTLTAEQMQVAEMMGLTPEQYASQIK